MKICNSLLIFIILFIGSTQTLNGQNFEVRGSLREWAKGFISSPVEKSLLETRLNLEMLSTLGENTAFRVNYYYIYDGIKRDGVSNLQEAYVDYYTDIVDIRFGKQIMAWGKADEINPTDILNPQILNNVTEEKSIRKIGLTALKTTWKFREYYLECIWKLEFDYMRILEIGSRWSFFSIPGIDKLPAPVLPGNKPGDTEWAFKLSRTISMYDFSLSYFDGWDNIFTPEFSFYPRGDMLYPILERLAFHRTKMYGFDFAGSVRSFGLWGEGAYFRTEDGGGTSSMIKNPYFQFVVGSDYTFDNGIRINLQYLKEYITKIDDDTEKVSEEAIISRLGFGLPIQEAVTCRLEKKFGFGEVNSFEIFTLYDTKDNGMLLRPCVKYSPEDAVMFEVGFIFFDGDEKSLFGRFGRNDEAYVKCTYSF